MRADRQTKGRGRLGRVWEMPLGNLALSGWLKLGAGEQNAAELSFVVALALYDTVVAFAPVPGYMPGLQLKWPNDVLLDGGKISGILLEREGDALILGIGVNIVAAPDVADKKTAALADAGLEVDAARFAEQLVTHVGLRRLQWRTQGFASIRTDWLALAHPVGTPLWVSAPEGGRVAGHFAGLAGDGALLLDTGAGEPRVFHAGDVWDSPAPAASA